MSESLREQLGGISYGLLAFFTLATAVYGLTGYSIYTDALGMGTEQLRYLYLLLGLLAAERLHVLFTVGVRR